MKFVSKAAAFGAAAAISATGLVAATGTTANAATVTKTYTCSLPVGSPFAVPVAFTLPALPTTAPAGASVPSLPVSATMTLSQVETATIQAEVAALTGTAPTAFGGPVSGAGSIGSTALPINLTVPSTTINTTGDTVLNATGATGAVKAPGAAGTYTVSLPQSITAKLLGSSVPGAVCTLPGSDATVGSLAVKAAPATLAVSAPKKAKLHHAIKVKVTTNLTGKAVAKIKGKKVASATIKSGKATLKIKKGLKKGANKIVVSVGSLKKTVKVKVK
ncbi:DUF6801 domain-containing protein [Nocardioides sp. Iso805N]|uniref:DUF6801 domain-containing protein n=1 Tax=Nocardioides sp. Iso805N TaxID=1283287 RepID=UPI000362FF5D|nr:DUF6801 domain-containing protein [Nocardioides sp. Iso805N]